MKKGLLMTLIAGSIALFGLVSTVYAEGPVVSQIPDIIIGDGEDNEESTVDLNIFEFPDALDLADYVTDVNTTSSWIIWRFEAETEDATPTPIATTDYSVNGYQVGDTEAANLTNVPTTGGIPTGASADTIIDLINETVSPGGSSGDAPFTTPSDDYVRAITFFASDGTLEDSSTFEIKIADGTLAEPAYDSVGPEWTMGVASYDFETGAQGWSASTDLGYGNPSSSSSGGALSFTASTTSDQYGIWESPSDAIDYVADSVYRVTWSMSTTQANTDEVPGMRLMTQTQAFVATNYMVVYGSERGIPGGGSQDFVTYFQPADLSGLIADDSVSHLYIEFDLLNFLLVHNPTGTISLDGVVVDRFTASGLAATTIQDYTDFSDWTQTYADTSFDVPTLALESGKATMESEDEVPTLGGGVYGGYQSPNDEVALEEGKLYRVKFTLKSDASDEADRANKPSYRMLVWTSDNFNNDTVRNTATADAMGSGIPVYSTAPSAAGTTYNVFLQPVEATGVGEYLGATVEIVDFSDDQFGKYTVDQVEIQKLDPPVAP